MPLTMLSSWRSRWRRVRAHDDLELAFTLPRNTQQVMVPFFYRCRHRIYLIQDNASYHTKQETNEWFKSNQRYVKAFHLPPYWPELNAQEGIWKYTRKYVTHNRFYEHPEDLCGALFHRFDYVREHPEEIEGLLRPFF